MNINLLLRQIRTSGFLSAMKFLSLLIGFAISLVILAWVKKELSYDKFWDNKDRIYRVSLEQYQGGELQFRLAPNYRGVTDLLLAELPEVEGRVRLHRDLITIFTPDAQVQDVKMFYADTCVFDILHRKILARESSQLFPDLNAVVISESLSKKLYGNLDPIGQSLKINEGWKFYVSAVFEDIPGNSHLAFDLLMTVPSLNYYMSNFNNVTSELDESKPFEYFEPGPYDRRSWEKFYGYSYIRIKEGTNMDDLRSKAEALITPAKLPSWFNDAKIHLIFQSIGGIHLHSDLSEEIKVNGNIFRVYTLLLVAVIVLIISLINFINLSVIDFYHQSVNSAIRIIHGARIPDLLKLGFLKEIMISIAAGLFSLLLGYYTIRELVPGAGSGWGGVLLVFAVLTLAALLTLILPQYHFRRHGVIELLKKKILAGSGGKWTRQVLVTLQFAISLFLISATIVIFFQLRFIRQKDPGFVKDSIIFSYSPMTMNQRPDIQEKLLVFRDRMTALPGLESFCTSSSIPGKDFLMHSERVSRAGDDPDKQSYFQILNVDEKYLETYGLKLVSGRKFTETYRYPGEEVIINEVAARKLGFLNPGDATGEVINVDGANYPVCGVVKDFHHLSLRQELMPVIIFKSLQWRYAVGYYSFKVNTANLDVVIPLISQAWSEIYPGERFLYKFMDDNYEEQYLSDRNFGKSVSLGSFLAILIACLGLLGYARYAAVKRIREIGIRKTFGASQNDILILFNAEIIRMVLVASIFSLPLAWILANKWLQNFAYRIDISLWMSLAALILTALIAVAVTFYVSWKASVRNPLESLRYE